MNLGDYYRILDLPVEASNDDIKKAYRKKARLYHPDLNPSQEAMEKFIEATEAYEFLISYHERIKSDFEAYQKAMDDWRKYRQDRSRRRATIYARKSYNNFRNSSLYKTTRIFDGTTIIFSLVVSVLVLLYTVTGYIYRLRNPVPGLERPSVFTFILLLLLGLVFFVIAFIYLFAWRKSSVRHKCD